MDLIHSREQYESLQNSISDRERRPEVISDLLREKLRLENIIHKEKLSKNELLRKFEVTSAELVETKARFKEDVEKLKTHLKHEKEKCEKISTQMQSSSQVLKAEVEVQKEQVNELRAASWTDLAVRLKSEIEVAISQELAKSSMCVSQAVGACEEKWKQKINDIQVQHQNDLARVREQFDNDIRFNLSRNEIKLEEEKNSIEEKLKREHQDSLEMMRLQERQCRISELNNETKKWEQVCSFPTLYSVYKNHILSSF